MKNENKALNIIKWISIVSLGISLLMLYLFIWHRKENVGLDYPVATDEVGQYGDFVGGVIGTILSVVLLYLTLKLQREDSTNNSKIYTAQQLNDEFFHLLDMYHRILDTLSFNDDDSFYEGKIALHKNVEDMYDGFDSSIPLSMRRKSAVSVYQSFYARERDFAPVYFRTLYRICEIVDNANCEESKKVEYIKILRAQLTDSELILMRYNAMTPLGYKFADYINKYNLLKHIPFFLLLEYKEWRRKIAGSGDVMKISNLLSTLKNEMSNLLKTKGGVYEKSSSKNKFHIKITCNEQRTYIELLLDKTNNTPLTPYDDLSPLDCFSHAELVSLLRYYMKDCFVLNSFNKLNRRKELIIDYEESHAGYIGQIKVWVKNNSAIPKMLKL